MLLNESELYETLEMLMNQWNVANSLKDDVKRERHLDRINYWITIVESKIEAHELKQAI